LNFKYIYFFICVLFFLTIRQNKTYAQEYGLNFKGQNYLLDERTSLELSPEQFINAQDEFELNFKLKLDFENKENTFGYIFRIINKEGRNIDLINSSFKKDQLSLVIGNTETGLPIKDKSLYNNKWTTVRLKFLLREKKILFSLNNNTLNKKTVAFKNIESYKIFFGANSYQEFSSSDLPEMSIKDIKILNNKSLSLHYPLRQCGGNETVDLLKKVKAKVSNPKWILCNHQKWNLKFSSNVNGFQLPAYNKKRGELYLLNNKELLTYTLKDNSFKKLPYQNGPISLSIDHRAIYNPNTNTIYCYLIDNKSYAQLDLITGKWSNLTPFNNEKVARMYQNHNSVFNVKNNVLYTLGGYGYFKYNNIVNKVNFTTTNWNLVSNNDTIFKPRYLAGSDILSDSIYIFGGYGSASGSQLGNPKSYFNLIAFDTKTNTFKEKFIVKKHLNDMIVAKNMWINESNRDFYALISDKIIHEGYLKLLKGNLDNSNTTIVGDSIPYKFLDIKSNASLYYEQNQKKLIAYTSYLNKENKTTFTIHTINFPTIKIDAPTPIKTTFFSKYWHIVLACFIFLPFVFYFFKKTKIKKAATQKTEENLVVISEEEEYTPLTFSKPMETNNYRIIFFGGFQIYNKNNEDITNKFSPLIKELFLLIWMYTFKNNKGISSEKLVDIIWYDKSPRKAQNNRSVNLTKLRKILRDLENCSVTKETGYWKIDNDHIINKTDHFELLQITNTKKSINKEKIDHLIKITEKGAFLFNLNYEWLEPFKEDISDRIIDTLVTFAEKFDIKSDTDFILHLSDCILNFDSINEEAVIFKCKAHHIKGNHSLAKSTFNKFQKEYQLLYAQDFKYSFQEIIR